MKTNEDNEMSGRKYVVWWLFRRLQVGPLEHEALDRSENSYKPNSKKKKSLSLVNASTFCTRFFVVCFLNYFRHILFC